MVQPGNNVIGGRAGWPFAGAVMVKVILAFLTLVSAAISFLSIALTERQKAGVERALQRVSAYLNGCRPADWLQMFHSRIVAFLWQMLWCYAVMLAFTWQYRLDESFHDRFVSPMAASLVVVSFIAFGSGGRSLRRLQRLADGSTRVRTGWYQAARDLAIASAILAVMLLIDVSPELTWLGAVVQLTGAILLIYFAATIPAYALAALFVTAVRTLEFIVNVLRRMVTWILRHPSGAWPILAATSLLLIGILQFALSLG